MAHIFMFERLLTLGGNLFPIFWLTHTHSAIATSLLHRFGGTADEIALSGIKVQSGKGVPNRFGNDQNIETVRNIRQRPDKEVVVPVLFKGRQITAVHFKDSGLSGHEERHAR